MYTRVKRMSATVKTMCFSKQNTVVVLSDTFRVTPFTVPVVPCGTAGPCRGPYPEKTLL